MVRNRRGTRNTKVTKPTVNDSSTEPKSPGTSHENGGSWLTHPSYLAAALGRSTPPETHPETTEPPAAKTTATTLPTTPTNSKEPADGPSQKVPSNVEPVSDGSDRSNTESTALNPETTTPPAPKYTAITTTVDRSSRSIGEITKISSYIVYKFLEYVEKRYAESLMNHTMSQSDKRKEAYLKYIHNPYYQDKYTPYYK
ncbi:MAG: hypothetical protein AAF195_01775, partial [Pseudomonadota bacterium]